MKLVLAGGVCCALGLFVGIPVGMLYGNALERMPSTI